MKKAFYLILAGIAIGILVAPDKGSETVRKIKEGFDDLKDQAMDHVNDLVSQGKDLLAKGKTAANDVKNDAANTSNEW